MEDQRMRLSSLGKVCLVCTSFPVDEPDDEFRYFVLDLDSEYSDMAAPLRPPTLRVGFVYTLYTSTSCVLDSTLYIFGDRYESLWSKNAFKYVLPSNDHSNVRLDFEMLEPISDMICGKRNPAALPTPDGKKILVFSRKFEKPSFCNVCEDYCDFELYDPVLDTWEQLPGFPLSWRKFDDFEIYAYTFIDNKNVLMLQREKHIFTLDFTTPDKQWEKMLRPKPSYRVPCSRYFIVVGDLKLTPTKGLSYDDCKTVLFEYPGLSVAPPKHSRGGEAMSVVELDERQCRFCSVQSWINEVTEQPLISFQVYRVDLVEYRNYKEEVKLEENDGSITRRLLPGMTLLKSFQFCLDKEYDGGWMFKPHSLFSVSAVSTPLQQAVDDGWVVIVKDENNGFGVCIDT